MVANLKTAVINTFIDPENGFLKLGLTDDKGGVLYVPAGETVTAIMGDIINKTQNGIFILGQDYHPDNHISFMTNHIGIMEFRINNYKEFLKQNGQPEITDENQLYQAAQQPVHFFNGYEKPPVAFPFNEIVLDENKNIIGVKEADGRIRKVEVETTSGLAPTPTDIGRVTKVKDEYFEKSFDEMRASGKLVSTQTLWTKHCVQGTESCLYPDDLNLPKGLVDKLKGDLMSRSIYHRDANSGNEFYVIRKGYRSEVDSYGIGVENDGSTMTPAWDVFAKISEKLKAQGFEKVIINVGGLATNFCVEFSANNISDFLAGHFKMKNIQTEINFVPEISKGIPIPGDKTVPFSEAGTAGRLEDSRGIKSVTVDQILAMQAPTTSIEGDLDAKTSQLKAKS